MRRSHAAICGQELVSSFFAGAVAAGDLLQIPNLLRRFGDGTVRGAAAIPAMQFQQWQDPAEGAFSVSLPAGWQVSGGTVRTTRIEAHYVVRAQSPDGGAQLFMDDPKIMMREVPNQATQMMGVRVGQVMPTGSGTNLVLEPYRAGAQFAAEYVQQSLCPGATAMHGGPLAAQTQALNVQFGPIAQAEGKTVHADAGDVSFKCGARIGYAYAVTVQAWQPGGPVSIWAVYRIAGYLANPADSAAAAAAVNQALGTFQMNQNWLQNYARECGDIAGNVIRESNAITQTTIQRSQQMQAQEESNYAAWKRNSDATSKAIEGAGKAITGSGAGGSNGNGHDYNANWGPRQCATMWALARQWMPTSIPGIATVAASSIRELLREDRPRPARARAGPKDTRFVTV